MKMLNMYAYDMYPMQQHFGWVYSYSSFTLRTLHGKRQSKGVDVGTVGGSDTRRIWGSRCPK